MYTWIDFEFLLKGHGKCLWHRVSKNNEMQHSAVQLSGTVTDIAGLLGNGRGATLPAKKKNMYLKCIIKATIYAKYPENLSKKMYSQHRL